MSTRPPPLGLLWPASSGYRSKVTPQPSRRSTSLMMWTSRMSGTSSSVVRPVASSAAAISLRALFLAPVTRTRPRRDAPPVTSKHSTGSPYGGPAAGVPPRVEGPLERPDLAPPGRAAGGPGSRVPLLGSDHDRPPAPHLHPHRRCRSDAPGRHVPGDEDRPAAGRVRPPR